MSTKCPKGTTKTIVTCGKPTVPPHDDEKNPGTCSRTKGFCVVPGFPAPDWACWQHGYRVEMVDLPFKDCRDAAETLDKGLDDDNPAGTTRPALKYYPVVTSSKDAKGRWTVTKTLDWYVDASDTVMVLPNISWPNMTVAEIAAVRNALDALVAHEQGHVKIAEDYASELTGPDGDSITCTSDTKQHALEEVDQLINSRMSDVIAELDKRGKEYDTKTQHGRKQSNVGGIDAVLKCP